MLRVAVEVTNRMPSARFAYYGPVTDGQEAYGRSCFDLHGRLELGEAFRFMGSTRDPAGAIRDSDLVLMTSIFSIGVVLWLVYGVRIRSAPVVFANLVTLVLSLVILALKFRYSRRERRVEPSADAG